jgi:hypothetical protein
MIQLKQLLCEQLGGRAAVFKQADADRYGVVSPFNAKKIAKLIYDSKSFFNDDEVLVKNVIVKNIKNIKQYGDVNTELQKLTSGRGIGMYLRSFLNNVDRLDIVRYLLNVLPEQAWNWTIVKIMPYPDFKKLIKSNPTLWDKWTGKVSTNALTAAEIKLINIYKSERDFEKITGSNITNSQYKKLRLIFPGNKFELKLVSTIKVLFGIITGAFTSVSSAMKIVDKLHKDGVVVDELVIGSHGDGKTLLITMDGKRYNFDTAFLQKLKNIIHPGTKIFFTACYGADQLEQIKTAAEQLGVGVYAAAGVYNPASNTAQKGFYWASPKKINKSNQTQQPWVLKNNDLIIYTQRTSTITPLIPITININSKLTGGYTLGQISTVVDTTEYNEINSQFRNSYNQKNSIQKTDELNLKDLWKDKIENIISTNDNLLNNWRKIRENFDKIKWNNEIQSGNVIIKVNNVDIRTLPLIHKSLNIDNQFLLKYGYCKQVASPPISWI